MEHDSTSSKGRNSPGDSVAPIIVNCFIITTGSIPWVKIINLCFALVIDSNDYTKAPVVTCDLASLCIIRVAAICHSQSCVKLKLSFSPAEHQSHYNLIYPYTIIRPTNEPIHISRSLWPRFLSLFLFLLSFVFSRLFLLLLHPYIRTSRQVRIRREQAARRAIKIKHKVDC